jgi:NTP pyrophosphatase (non-canonical NTP hydrolase)
MRDNFNEDALPVEPNMHTVQKSSDQLDYESGIPLCGTRSGRFDSSKPNLSNPPQSERPLYCAASGASLGKAINDLALLCRHRADAWYYDLKTGERLVMNDGERMMLMVSEIAEAFEGKRKDLMDSHLTHRKAVDVELADLLIRVLDYAGENCQDLGGALIEKLEYNRNRADHKKEARLGANGKRF